MKLAPSIYVIAALLAAPASFLVTPATPALAQNPCPGGPGPGERIVAVHNGLPLCAAIEDGPATGPSVDEWNAGVAELSQALRNMSPEDWQAYRDVTNDINRALASPGGAARPAKIVSPGWKYVLKKGSCAAIYYSPNGLVRVAGPTKALPFSTITFHTPAIDRPETNRLIPIYLENSDIADGKTAKATVKAVNWATSDRQTGFITFEIPSTAELVSGLTDRMAFKVAVAGKTVADLQWDGGNEAKAKLGKCLGMT